MRHLKGGRSRLKRGGHHISSQTGGRCCLKCNSIWVPFLPLPCASRLSVFSHTTEAAFFTSMLILPASQAHQHRTVCSPTPIDKTFWLVRCIISKEPSQDNYCILWRERDECHACKSWVHNHKLKADVTHLTPGWRGAMYCHHCSLTSQRGGFVSSTQYSSKEQSEADAQFCFRTHLLVSSGPHSECIDQCSGRREGCASQALVRGPNDEIQHSAGW